MPKKKYVRKTIDYLWIEYGEDGLPVAVCDSPKELAMRKGINPQSVRLGVQRYERGEYKTSIYMRVPKDED